VKNGGKKYLYAFLPFDCSQPLQTEKINNEELRDVSRIVWGQIPAAKVSDIDMRAYYGMAKTGFDIVSCQFTIHYFMKDDATLKGFIDNVELLLKPGGRLIGCCLDGSSVATLLKDIPNEGIVMRSSGSRVIWQIKKLYPTNASNSLGHEIEVYMESIGKAIVEYVCYFELLQAALEARGIVLVQSAMFQESYDELVTSGSGKRHDAIKHMSQDEKQYSFLNRWFVFEKKK
jgi:hypothetical protein